MSNNVLPFKTNSKKLFKRYYRINNWYKTFFFASLSFNILFLALLFIK